MAETDMQAAVDVVIKDPAGSVKQAMTPAGREFYALSALTLTVQTPTLWPQLRDAGILNVFIELLVDEWTSPEVEATAPGWVFALTGIINILVSLKKDERNGGAQAANDKQYEIIRQAYPRIETSLWKLHTTANADKLIDVLALGMFHLSRVPGLHPILYTPHTLGIVGYCWKSAKGIAARKVSCLALRQLLTAPNKPAYTLDSFFATTPFEEVTRTLVHNVFLNPAIAQDKASSQLGVELVTADAFVNIGQKEASRFVDEAKIHGHVVALVRSRAKAIDDEDQKWGLIDASAPFLNNMLNASTDTANAFADLINGYEFLELASDAIIAAAPRTDSYGSAWFRIFKMLIHTAHCTDTTCRVHSTPAFSSAIHAHFAPLYIGTLDNLDLFIAKEASKGFIDHDSTDPVDEGENSPAARNDIGNVEDGIRRLSVKEDKNSRAALWQVTLSWRALGATLGVNEEIMRGDKPGNRTTGTGAVVQTSEGSVEGKKANVCWWAKCDTKIRDDATPYKRCSGCRCVTYCSTEHQKLDWKDGAHKDVCMIIKNA